MNGSGLAVQVRALRKSYHGVPAVRGIDLRIAAGEVFALLGPNGAGKTTLIGIIASLVTKTGGTVEVFGHDIDRELAPAKSELGLVPQEINFNQFERVIDILVNQAGYYGIPRRLALERAEKYLNELGLWDRREQSARALSGGLKRRLMIARALVHEPPLLILDEPTAGVDIELRRSMWDFLRTTNAAGTTIILTTHYLEEAEALCRRIAIIQHGELADQGGMRELLNRLHTETFVLDLRHPIERAPELSGYTLRRVDPTTLELDVPREQNINEAFEHLSAQGVEVLSMRNKANRLEEIFLQLVEADRAEAQRRAP